MEAEDRVEQNDKFWPLIVAFAVVLGLWLLSCFGLPYVINEPENRGTFGDSFGAINALFSGLAMGGLIYTIHLQRKELALQRLELKETRQELKRAADAQEKSEQALNEQIESMKISARLTAMTSLLEMYDKDWKILASRFQTDSDIAKAKKEKMQAQLEKFLDAL